MARVPACGTRVSRTHEPDDPELGSKLVRSFRLDELEDIPGEQRAVYHGLLHAMPEALSQRGFTKQVTELLKGCIGLDVDLWFDGYKVYETKRLRALIPGTTCLFVVGLAPREEKLLAEIDLQFAYRVIAELLGTKGAAMDVQRPLTEIEQGVLLFVALKVVALVQSKWTHREKLAFRIDDIRCDVRSIADVLRYESTWLAANWKLVLVWQVEPLGGGQLIGRVASEGRAQQTARSWNEGSRRSR